MVVGDRVITGKLYTKKAIDNGAHRAANLDEGVRIAKKTTNNFRTRHGGFRGFDPEAPADMSTSVASNDPEPSGKTVTEKSTSMRV